MICPPMSDSDSASSDTDADTVAADTTAAVPSPRWWRNRRRGFYLIVTAASVALLWGGWSWWYRAGFPMPPVQPGTDPFSSSKNKFFEVQYGLLTWKIQRETRRLRLEGTTWEDAHIPEMGAMEFGKDGRIHLRPSNALEALLSGLGPLHFDPEPNEQIALVRFDGAAYRFDGRNYLVPKHPIGIGFWPESPNLEVEDSPWDIRGFYDGSILELHFRTRNPGESFSQRDLIARLRKVEAGAEPPQ